MKNLNNIGVFLDMVVDQNGRVYELTNAFASDHGASDVRETLQEINVIEHSHSKPFRCCWIFSANVVENGFQVS